MSRTLRQSRDLSVSHHTREPSLAQNDPYCSLFAHNPLPTWIYDAETLRFLAVNDSTVHHYGYSRSEFLAMTILDIRPGPEVPILLAALAGNTEKIMASRVWKHVKKDGTLIQAEVTAHKVTFDRAAAFLVTVRDVTEIQKTQEAIRKLTAQVMCVRDTERRRIARELHDNPVQSLAALILKLESLSGRLSSDRADCRRAVLDCEALAEECISELRTTSYLLHPPELENLGLRGALELLVKGFRKRSAIAVTLELPSNIPPLSEDIELALYRVTQEGLLNAQHHSGAKHVKVKSSVCAKQIILHIRDDGHGFRQTSVEAENIGVGISSMRERLKQVNGSFDILSSKTGTTLTAIVPVRDRNETLEDRHRRRS